MSRPCLKVTVLCLILTLGASLSLSAAPHKPAPGRASVLDSPWTLFAHLWGSLASLWAQEGASADPDGRSVTRSTTDAGCSADPSGRCTTSPAADTGATLDPSGK